jgi:hypothetical protein
MRHFLNSDTLKDLANNVIARVMFCSAPARCCCFGHGQMSCWISPSISSMRAQATPRGLSRHAHQLGAAPGSY